MSWHYAERSGHTIRDRGIYLTYKYFTTNT